MNSDTFEFERRGKSKLEKYEWDNIWIENANEEGHKRILLIGDSITNGFRPFLNELLSGGEFYADQLATSKAVDNEHLIRLIDYVLEQNPSYDIIHFMFGGHGWHLSHNDYYSYYEKIILHIKEKCGEARMIISSFTPIAEKTNLNNLDKKNDYIFERNKKVKLLAEKSEIEFIDIYDIINSIAEKNSIYCDDGVHFKESGYKIIAKALFEKIR